MADPITTGMAGVSMAGSAASGLLGAFGASQGAEAKAGMYSYQAGISRMNERFSKWNAKEAVRTGDLQAVQLGMKQRQQLGQIAAGQGASGIDMGSGTSVKVRESQEAVNRMDQGILRRNTQKKAYAHQIEATGHDAQAKLYDQAAVNSIEEGKIAAWQSLIGGATSVSSKWTQGRQTGIF